MAYNANIPQATDRISISQGDILNNFIAINAFVDTNHYGFGDPNQGKHRYVQIPEVAAPANTASTASIYAAVGATSTRTELVFKRSSNSGGAPFDNALIPFTEAVFNSNGWTMLPSGMILQWGHNTQAGGASSTNFNFPRSFPTACLNVTATPNVVPSGLNTDNIISSAVLSTTQYTISRKTHFGTACSFNFFAIGY